MRVRCVLCLYRFCRWFMKCVWFTVQSSISSRARILHNPWSSFVNQPQTTTTHKKNASAWEHKSRRCLESICRFRDCRRWGSDSTQRPPILYDFLKFNKAYYNLGNYHHSYSIALHTELFHKIIIIQPHSQTSSCTFLAVLVGKTLPPFNEPHILIKDPQAILYKLATHQTALIYHLADVPFPQKTPFACVSRKW